MAKENILVCGECEGTGRVAEQGACDNCTGLGKMGVREHDERIRKEERERIKNKIFNCFSAFEYNDSRMKLESGIEEIFAQLEKEQL